MELTFEEHDPCAVISQPTLSLRGDIAEAFLNAFADMLHTQHIKPTTQSFLEGQLISTRVHLEDMRALVSAQVATLPKLHGE